MSDVVLMLGAGASRDANLPDARGLVESFLERGDVDHIGLVTEICDRLSELDAVLDVEQLLSALDQLELRDSAILSAFTDGWLSSVDYPPSVYAKIRESIYNHIREQLHLQQGESDYYDYIISLALIYGGLDIFSLNYDLALELACLKNGVAFTDGFDPRWNPELLSDGGRFPVRIHKVHGSLLWHRLDTGLVEKVAISPRRDAGIRHYSGSALSEALVYPGAAGKDVHADPYATLIERLRSSLRGASTLVAIGYSFRDLYIKTIVTEALSSNSALRMIVVDPSLKKMLDESDKLAPTRVQFGDLRGRIHAIPLGAEQALSTHEVRASVPQAAHLADLEDQWDDLRRRGSHAAVLSHGRKLVDDSLAQGWAFHLVEAAKGDSGDDLEQVRERRLRQDAGDANETPADLLLSLCAFRASTNENTARQARSALTAQLSLACRGVLYSPRQGPLAGIGSERLPARYADHGAIYQMWRDREQALSNLSEQLEELLARTEFHLSDLDSAIDGVSMVLADLETARAFFAACVHGDPAAPSAIQNASVGTGTSRRTAYFHEDARPTMAELGERWSDGPFLATR